MGKSLQRETEVSQTLPPEGVVSAAGETKPTKEATVEPSAVAQPPTPKPFDVNSALDAKIALYYRSRSREEALKAYVDDWDRRGILNVGKGDDRLKESIARQMHETRIELGDIPESEPFDLKPYLTIMPKEADEASRILLLDLEHISFWMSVPTTVMTSDNRVANDFLGVDNIVLTCGELICTRFCSQGKIRDIL